MSRVKAGALDWLRERRDKTGRPLISEEEYEAGDRLRQDFVRGGMMPRVTSAWGGSGSHMQRRRANPDHEAQFAERTLTAQDRFRRALAAVQPESSGILVDVCCLEIKLTEVEKRLGWPQRSGKIVLQMALRQLARHYGLLPDQSQLTPAAPHTRHWGADDFRPQIDGTDTMATPNAARDARRSGSA